MHICRNFFIADSTRSGEHFCTLKFSWGTKRHFSQLCILLGCSHLVKLNCSFLGTSEPWSSPDMCRRIPSNPTLLSHQNGDSCVIWIIVPCLPYIASQYAASNKLEFNCINIRYKTCSIIWELSMNSRALLFPEEANVYDHYQHFLYGRLKKKYARPEEFTDHCHNLGATFGPICERCESLEVSKVLIFMFCSSPHWPPEETGKTAVT